VSFAQTNDLFEENEDLKINKLKGKGELNVSKI